MTTIKQLAQGRYKQNLFIKLDSTNGLHTGQARYRAHTPNTAYRYMYIHITTTLHINRCVISAERR